jgi:diguanylate cyclase (GGDEF)-like protein/PAS domain S-box-containing protein
MIAHAPLVPRHRLVSLRLRLVLLVLLASVPLLGITLYTAREIRSAEVSSSQTGMQELARIAEGRLGNMIAASESLLYALAQVPAVARGDADACARLYEEIRSSSPRYTSLVVADERGLARCDNAGASSTLYIGDRDYFVRARATGRFAVGAPVISRLSGRTVIPLAYPLHDTQGNFKGAIASGIDLRLFGDVFVEALVNRDLIFNIWDAEGGLLYPSAQGTPGANPDSGIRRAVLARQAHMETVEAPGLDGAASFYVITGLEGQVGARAALSLGIPMAQLRERSERAFLRIFVYFSVVFAVCIAAALALAEFTVRRRVVALAAAAERLSAGDLGARSGLARSNDELGAVGRAFDAMAATLQQREAEVRRAREMARLAHVITRPGGAFESWSETLPQLIGIEAAQMPQSTREWLEILHPDDRDKFRQKSVEAATTGSRLDLEYRLRRADGAWIDLRQVIEPIQGERDTQGRQWWFSTLQDITEQRQAEKDLRASESLKGAILESSLDCIVTIDHEGKIIEFNPAAEMTFGFARDQALGRTMVDLIVPPRLRDAHRRGFAHHLATGEGPVLGKRLELAAIRADGTEFPIELAITEIKSASTPTFTAFIRDITRRRESETKIKRLNRVHAVLSGINGLIVRVRERKDLYREACRIAVHAGGFKLAWIGLVDRQAARVTPVAFDGDAQGYIDRMPMTLDEGTEHGRGLAGRAVRERKPMIANDIENDTRVLLRKQALVRGFRSLVVLPLIVSDSVVGLLALYAESPGFFDEEEMRLLLELAGDISFALEHLEQEDKLEYLAYYDSITGLANRTLFLERLEQHLHEAGRVQHQLAVVIVDIDRFRTINDSFGRQVGDALLKQMATRFLEVAGDPGMLARLGADHFAVMIPHVRVEQDLVRMIEASRSRILAEPFLVDGTQLRVATKAGIALFPNDGANAESLLRNAEAALMKAKQAGERQLFYTPQMTERVAETLALENKLRQALEKEEFVLHYQPKVDLQSRAIVGVEALIRWQSPELGLVPPGKFIGLLEETGLILEVGSWALTRAALDHRAWTEMGIKPPRVAVNVSPIQLRQRDFVGSVERAVMEGVAPVGIDLEITESVVMEDVEATIAKLKRVRALGIKMAIDDFGTGYSSLAYLAKLPVETLKIDRSFVITMLKDLDTATLVQTIITLAHSLRLTVVAEGVDAEEQAQVLRLLRCDQMQGYLYSKPVPAADLVKLLQPQAS